MSTCRDGCQCRGDNLEVSGAGCQVMAADSLRSSIRSFTISHNTPRVGEVPVCRHKKQNNNNVAVICVYLCDSFFATFCVHVRYFDCAAYKIKLL